MSDALLAAGYEVAVAETAAAGVEVARDYHPAAILFSTHGPQIGAGTELYAHLRSEPSLAEVPVLVFDQPFAASVIPKAPPISSQSAQPTHDALDALKQTLQKRRLLDQLRQELGVAGDEVNLLRETRETLTQSLQQAQ
ncbi:MAG: hypothetical protein JO166_04820, partial [Deltaproteobacteria bacterium]|nr:hypothetical protein [Deltaproteobacteria bacterium]